MMIEATEIVQAWVNGAEMTAHAREAAADGLREWRASWVLAADTRDRALAYVTRFVSDYLDAEVGRMFRRARLGLPLGDLLQLALDEVDLEPIAEPFAAAVLAHAADEIEVAEALDGSKGGAL